MERENQVIFHRNDFDSQGEAYIKQEKIIGTNLSMFLQLIFSTSNLNKLFITNRN